MRYLITKLKESLQMIKRKKMLDTICDVSKAAYERGWISTRDS
jgi:hypothetical protein